MIKCNKVKSKKRIKADVLKTTMQVMHCDTKNWRLFCLLGWFFFGLIDTLRYFSSPSIRSSNLCTVSLISSTFSVIVVMVEPLPNALPHSVHFEYFFLTIIQNNSRVILRWMLFNSISSRCGFVDNIKTWLEYLYEDTHAHTHEIYSI